MLAHLGLSVFFFCVFLCFSRLFCERRPVQAALVAQLGHDHGRGVPGRQGAALPSVEQEEAFLGIQRTGRRLRFPGQAAPFPDLLQARQLRCAGPIQVVDVAVGGKSDWDRVLAGRLRQAA
jgi:hypothetical protein